MAFNEGKNKSFSLLDRINLDKKYLLTTKSYRGGVPIDLGATKLEEPRGENPTSLYDHSAPDRETYPSIGNFTWSKKKYTFGVK
jgi:hypothetical protein